RQVRRFDVRLSPQGRDRARRHGILQVRETELRWRATMAYPWMSTFEIVVPWDDVAQVDCLRLRSLHRLDVLCFALRDGRELTLYSSRPVEVERAIEHLGVHISSPRLERSSSHIFHADER